MSDSSPNDAATNDSSESPAADTQKASASPLPVDDTTLSVLGEVLDLLAGIEARQKVLAREIATMRALLHNQPADDVLQELHDSFSSNLEEERNRILSRVSLLSSFPSQEGNEEA